MAECPVSNGPSGAQRVSKKRAFDPKRNRPETKYDENGNWEVFQHQDQLRSIDNPRFCRYYRELQKIVPEDQFPALLEELRTPLPTTIWINDTDPLAHGIAEHFRALDPSLVEPIPWYPRSGMAWRIKADRTQFRKLPAMQPLRRYLIHQTALGTISRQEEVSMIPPLLLDIQPNDICLDMCASPGSKTAQMLVELGRHKLVKSPSPAKPFPFDYLSPGVIVANELDVKRANMLVHQCKRLRLLFPFALFCNHDARYFPDLPNGVAASATVSDAEASETRFDKILCDVVCSGDGTIRKAPFIFKIWSPKEALGLQHTQVQIALRACHLLKVGGRLVYSTCSLNPIENEAVVCQIVQRTSGAMKLVDGHPMIPGLCCDPGLRSWVVTATNGDVVSEPSAQCHPALFPPKSPIDGLDLTLCMRLLPRHCNGGGFFIAVFDKIAEFRLPSPKPAVGLADGDQVGERKFAKRGRQSSTSITAIGGGGEGAAAETASAKPPAVEKVPPQFFPATDEMVRSLVEFYHLPQFPVRNLVSRAGNGERTLTVGINTTASLVSDTALAILHRKRDNLIVVSAGLRVLAHENLDKGWRIAAEAAPLFGTLIQGSPRLLSVDVELLAKLIDGGKLKDVLLEDIPNLELREKLLQLTVGTVVLEVTSSNPAAAGGTTMYTVALRARSRLQLLVDHEDLVGLGIRLGLAHVEADDGGDEE